jgi:putative acetyltransferase
MMDVQPGIHPVVAADIPRLVEVWEASVRATHDFLSEDDIQFFRPSVRDELYGALDLACVRDADGRLAGFVGVAEGKVEALFIHPDLRGRGAGRALLDHAVTALGATRVDVNEQNEQAVGFYRRMGFEVEGRSPLDAMGKPFPLLHMRLPAAAE